MGETGSFYHQWFHQFGINLQQVSPQMGGMHGDIGGGGAGGGVGGGGGGRGGGGGSVLDQHAGQIGHWGWTAFPDSRGIMGGFNYFYCADGTVITDQHRTLDSVIAA
jgi:hypothetical protein